jgi:hypothetical protein
MQWERKPSFSASRQRVSIEVGGILNNGDNGFDISRVQMLYQREDPPLGPIAAGRSFQAAGRGFFFIRLFTTVSHVPLGHPEL